MPCVENGTKLPIECATLGRSTVGFGAAGSNKFSHGQVLCPALVAINFASCATLTSAALMTGLLAPVAKERLCCRLAWAGMAQDAHSVAVFLTELARLLPVPATLPNNKGDVRFVATHAGNGWLALVIATYLRRVHGSALHGLLVEDGKSEWVQAGDVRKLMRQIGVGYRKTSAFEPLAELALLSHSPVPNKMIMPIAGRAARAILPRRWEGDTRVFDVCLRVGSPLELEALTRDFVKLAPFCRTMSFWTGVSGGGERVPRTGGVLSDEDASIKQHQQFPGAAFHLAAFSRAGGVQPTAHRAGNWTIIKSNPPAELHFANDYVDPPPPPPPPPLPPLATG